MQCDQLGSPAWWSRLGHKLPSPVRAARQTDGVIRQKNSSVLPYTLTLNDGQELRVVVKLVDLNANSYRDKQHRDRSTQSYKVESTFYKHFGHRLHDATARMPELLHEQWHPDDAGLTVVMEDLRGESSAQSTRLSHQALALDYHQTIHVAAKALKLLQMAHHNRVHMQAVLALQWLGKMHSACWGASPSGIWPKGAYWTLDKRRDDLHKMPEEWDKVLLAFKETFPEIFTRQSVKELGPRLAAVAGDIDHILDIDMEQPHSLQTIVHGDFKTANLFFSPSAEAARGSAQALGAASGSEEASVSACDFQWCGNGLAVTDVMYLLWTSVSPAVIHEHEDALLRCYHHMLLHEVQRQQHKQHDITAYGFDRFCQHYQLAYLDYVRYLIGAMWGSVTPETCNKLAQDLNQGMHKRSAIHLAYMVDKADVLLNKFEEGLLDKHHCDRQLELHCQHRIGAAPLV